MAAKADTVSRKGKTFLNMGYDKLHYQPALAAIVGKESSQVVQCWTSAVARGSQRVMPRAFFANAQPMPLGAGVLVGVSGGRDSVALLHWLRSQSAGPLVVCHVDHALRAESAEDARFVEKLARGWDCDFTSERVDVQALAKRRKLSLETAAREARYAFFAKVARERGVATLVLGHHADDQVETFLFNLLRGAGPGGLGGMAAVSERADGLRVVRPLLGLWREEIDAYIAQHALPFREDASNADAAHTRNRIRHAALPALSAALGRDVRAALWRAAELLRAEDAHLSSATELSAPPTELEVATLRALPLALQRRLVHAWLLRGGVGNVGFAEVESVLRLLQPRIAKVNLPGDRHARRKARRIFLE